MGVPSKHLPFTARKAPRRGAVAPAAEKREDRERRLFAYMEAFLGTDDELIREFEAAGIESWLNQDRTNKR